MQVDNYTTLFHNKPPLARMLRRQIENTEYIALTDAELNTIANNPQALNQLHFVIPMLKMVRGYFATEMKIVNLGEIKEIKSSTNDRLQSNFSVHFADQTVISLRSTDRFIRWLGL